MRIVEGGGIFGWPPLFVDERGGGKQGRGKRKVWGLTLKLAVLMARPRHQLLPHGAFRLPVAPCIGLGADEDQVLTPRERRTLATETPYLEPALTIPLN